MKKLITLSILLLISISIFSQSSCIPDLLHLTAVARDDNGSPITSQIDVKVEIYQGDPIDTNNSTLLYCEQIQNIIPNSVGEFSLDFGDPNLICVPPSVLMSNLDWTNCDMWYKLSWRQTGNPDYFPIVTNKFSSIPFAFAARSSENGKRVNGVNVETLDFMGSNGISNVKIENDTDFPNHGIVRIRNEEGASKAAIWSDGSLNGVGRVITYGQNGTINTQMSFIGSENNHGALYVHNEFQGSNTSAAVYAGNETNDGRIYARGPNGALNFFVRGAVSGSTDNHGSASVYDVNGTNQAGMYVNASNQGVLYADTKNFRIEHPNRKGKEIWYASLEGPEAAAYERGTSTLVNGESIVEFSDHYQLVANHQTMTVVLTPLSADSKGMAVVEKTESGFKVKELSSGTGNYEFDWRVECVRKGHENYKVIRDALDIKIDDSSLDNEKP